MPVGRSMPEEWRGMAFFRRAMLKIRALDARLFQIVFLATLLTIGVLIRDFSLQPAQMLLAFAAGLATQLVWTRALGLQNVGVLSALITCFGLSLLLRADSLWVHPLMAVWVISAKFMLRWRGKHLFNPANLGVITALLVLPGAWISPGQWGNDLAYAVWFIALGGIVTQRARRIDTSWIFLATFFGLIVARLWYLDVAPLRIWAILQHQLHNGAILLFAFFMISDPMTTPNRPSARVAHAIIVALVAWGWQMLLYRPNGAVWALFLCVPLVPLFDHYFPGVKHAWKPAPT